ncbi:hypothetical protein RTG_02210 [Rhodotorula toruloides ATCC 204091]|nr:hypothetical protein RTG_02210 [Rhodotorula toruloides ATCC 204091]KAK4330930.1 hypothetical protein RTBOTA2_006856 [Rhodotorula toruloides]
MKTVAFLPLALALVPATSVTATPPPALIDALSAYSAAGVVPTIPPGIKHIERFAKRSKDQEAPAPTPAAQKGMEKIVILPGSGPGKKINGTSSKPLKHLSNEKVFDDAPKRRGLLATIESKLGMATTSAELSHESGKVVGDRQHYWYIEDSEDQSKWRKKDAGKSSSSAQSSSTSSSAFASASSTKDKRDIVDALANIGDELDAAGVMSSPTSTAGFVTSTRPASASSTAAPTSSSSASSAAAPASTTASGNSTDVSWTDPSSWGQGISNEVTSEYNDLKTRLNNLSILSKVGLATLVIVSTIALGFLIYCCCKLNQRRRRRNAAERVHAKLQAQQVATGGRSFDERATAIPMRGYGSASTSASAPQDKKGKRRLSWSARQ